MFEPIFDAEWLREKLAEEIEKGEEKYSCITVCGIFFESRSKFDLEDAEPDPFRGPSQEEQVVLLQK